MDEIEKQNELEELLERLSTVPQRLKAALDTLAQQDGTARDGEWSANDILAHLRTSHGIVSPRIYYVLVRDNPALTAFDAERWQQVARYAELAPERSLEALTMARDELVSLLSALTPEEWQRSGTHEVAGALTVRDIAVNILTHDEEHINQLEAMIKAGEAA